MMPNQIRISPKCLILTRKFYPKLNFRDIFEDQFHFRWCKYCFSVIGLSHKKSFNIVIHSPKMDQWTLVSAFLKHILFKLIISCERMIRDVHKKILKCFYDRFNCFINPYCRAFFKDFHCWDKYLKRDPFWRKRALYQRLGASNAASVVLRTTKALSV